MNFEMFFTIRRKYLQVAMVLGLLLVVTLSLLLTSVFNLKNLNDLNYMDSLSLSVWKSGNKDGMFDAESTFNHKVSALLAQRKKNDFEDRYWRIDTEITTSDTQLTIPEYFRGPVEKRPEFQPFDPRWTLALYYNYIRREAKRHPKKIVDAPFHWSDWVDMGLLNHIIFDSSNTTKSCNYLDNRQAEEQHLQRISATNKHEALDPATFCKGEVDDSKLNLGFTVFGYPGPMTNELAMVAGRAYLYTLAPPPTSVIFLTHDGSYNITTAQRSKIVHNGMVDAYVKDNADAGSINTLNEFRKLQKSVPAYKDKVIKDYEVHLKHEDFLMQPVRLLKELSEKKTGTTLTAHEASYLESLRYALAVESNPPKYFSEARLMGTKLGDHYDWRFFGGINLGTQDQAATLHRLIRTWLSFCRKQGITTWMAHGSLLSWYWNGIAFPWDNDIDVQVPVMELHKLSLYFNQSLIVEDVEDGFGRYFLDCGTFITQRAHSNGNNNIDARFIDVDSGLYIDITGLAVSSTKSPERYNALIPENVNTDGKSHYDINNQLQVYNCRNNHFSSLGELSPLVRSYVEGEIAYIPRRYSDILTTEYRGKGLVEKFFDLRYFMPQLRLWVHQDDLMFFLRNRQQWLAHYSGNLQQVDSDVSKPVIKGKLSPKELSVLLELLQKDLLELLHNDEILMEYVSTRDMTSVHENEIMRLLFGKSTEKTVFQAPDFKPLKFEPFLDHMFQDYNTFEKEVKRYLALLKEYNKAKDKKVPAQSSTFPAQSTTVPAMSEKAPANSEKVPAEGEKAPAISEKVPAEGEKVPAEGETAPAISENAPAEGAKVPPEGEKVPAEGAKVPAEGEKVPAEGETAPAISEKVPPKVNQSLP